MEKNDHVLSGQLPFWHFDSELMVYSDGSLGGAFKLTGFDISCLTPDEINGFTRHIENLLISADEGLRLQVFYRLSPNVQKLIQTHADVSSDACDRYKPIADARLSYFRKNESNRIYFVPETYFFVRSRPHTFKKRRLWESPKLFEHILAEEYEKHKSKFNRALTQIESSLNHAGLEPERLSRCGWFELIFEYLNLDRTERHGRPTLRDEDDIFSPSLVDQLCLTDLEVFPDHLKIGNLLFRSITLKTLPESFTYSSMIEEFTTLPFHFWISQSVFLPNQSKEQGALELKRRMAFAMASGSENVTDLEAEGKLGHIEGLLRELMEGSDRLASFDFTVILWGRSKDELEERTDEVLKAFHRLNQSEGVVETLPCFDAFIHSLPGACTGFRHRKIKTSNAAHLLPLYGSWCGNKRPVCLIPNREGSLFSYDPWAKHLPAWNGLIIGQTGSGKSFVVSQLMLMLYGTKPTPRIIWIDNGASSERLLEVLDGEFIDLNLDSGVRINLFDIPKGSTRPNASRLKLILAVLEAILKEQDCRGLKKRERALLEEAVLSAYDKRKGSPYLSDLKQILESHSDPDLKKFAQILSGWVGDSGYGKLLDGASNIDLSKDLVTIEVQGLTNHPELKDILLLLLTAHIQNMAMQDIERPTQLIVDESERLFKTELAKQFVITCYRTWRKYNAGIWAISQNYRDFLSDPEVRDALMPNSTSVIVLRQRKIDWAHFQETFDFNDAQIQAIKSLEIVKGQHSEFFLMQDERQIVLRLVPEPLSYWICTSDARDKAEIANMEKTYPELSKIEILQRLAFNNEEIKEAA